MTTDPRFPEYRLEPEEREEFDREAYDDAMEDRRDQKRKGE